MGVPKPEILRTGHNPTKHHPQMPPGAPPCPRHIRGEARKEWRRVVRELMQLGVLSKIDRAALAAYCQLYARWSEAEARVRTDGMTTETKQGNIIQNPYLGIANTALKLMRQYLIEFGLTPASRSRIEVDPSSKSDPLKAFIADSDSPIAGRIGVG